MTDDEARARLAAVIAECDRVVADAEINLIVNSVTFWPRWTGRKTAERIRAIAQGEA